MVVTRSWLQEYINLDGISDSQICQKLNQIGLEVDSYKKYEIPAKVVVGEIKSCSKHPDADKLNVCQIDVGQDEVVQIVCGASNVVNAKYVAVATVGAVLPGNFKIKKAKLRGVESFGMVCSSSELGLPEIEDGIMILDDSIGELIVGKELNEYSKFADSVIEIGLTANRGDCLSIYGVARDLAAGLKIELKPQGIKEIGTKSGIANSLSVKLKDEFSGALRYTLAEINSFEVDFLTKLRAAFVELESSNELELLLAYATHSCGVLFRAYDFDKLANEDKVNLEVCKSSDFVVEVKCNNKTISTVGVNANEDYKAKNCKNIIIEASYIEPEFVADGVVQNSLKTDNLYYNSFRGSEPDLEFGIEQISSIIIKNTQCSCSDSFIRVGKEPQEKFVGISVSEITSIIGYKIAKSEIVDILKSLNLEVTVIDDDKYRVLIPQYRHDIKNSFDIAEEILRIYGIDNIDSKPLVFEEKIRINETYNKFKAKQSLTNRAIAAGFYESITYAFASKEQQQKYGFATLKDELELLNPIVNELNTLRVTMFTNLLNAVSQNVKYGKKSIPLFEIGVIFDSNRVEREVVSFVFSGELNRASVKNSAKAQKIDFASFVDKVGSVIGEFKLAKTEPTNALMHPYQSAKIIKDNKTIGYIAKLHPKAAKDFGIDDTFICEVELDDVLPKHKNASALSNFQPVSKDLSVVVDKALNFYDVAKVLQEVKAKEPLLRDFYPLDIYSDESLKDKKSLTIRFAIQSFEKTLNDQEIEDVMANILNELKAKFNAELR